MANDKLLIHSDTTDGSTVFVDSSDSAHTIVANGNVHHDTAQAKFGTSSIYFDGAGDFLSIADSPDWAFGDADFTVDFWLRAAANANQRDILLKTGLNAAPWTASLELTLGSATASNWTGGGGYVGVHINYTGSWGLQFAGSTNICDDDWHHIVVTRQGDDLKLYIDDVLDGSGSYNFSYPSRNVIIGGQPSDRGFTGYLDEIRIATTPVGVLIYMQHEQMIGSYLQLYLQHEQVIEIDRLLYLQSYQLISNILSKSQTQLLSMAPVLRHASTQILAQARQARLLHEQSMDTTTPIYLQSEQVMQGLVQVALAVTQVMRCYGAPVALEMLQTWAAYGYNLVYLPVVQMLGSEIDTVLQELQFSVTVAGQRVGVTDCALDRKGFAVYADITLRKRSDWINKNIGDPVVLTVLSETYQLIIINKPQAAQIGQGKYEIGYILQCASITVQITEGLNPDIAASRVTATFPAGTWLSEILDVLTDGVCTYFLAEPDMMVGEYNFVDAQRYDALREVLPADYGWIIKTDAVGVLQIRQWAKPEIGGLGQKELTMSRKTLTPPADTLYTEVRISNYNQTDGTSGLRLEVIDNGDGTGTIHGSSVPWTDAFAIYDSDADTAPSLLFSGGDVEEVEVEDTDVEFVDFVANLSRPCYSDPVINWGQNDSLSPVSYTEAGILSTEIEPGFSVSVSAKYLTRRKTWTFDNKKVDVTQVRLKYDATN